eukprot:g42211.t1
MVWVGDNGKCTVWTDANLSLVGETQVGGKGALIAAPDRSRVLYISESWTDQELVLLRSNKNIPSSPQREVHCAFSEALRVATVLGLRKVHVVTDCKAAAGFINSCYSAQPHVQKLLEMWATKLVQASVVLTASHVPRELIAIVDCLARAQVDRAQDLWQGMNPSALSSTRLRPLQKSLGSSTLRSN